MIIVLYHGTIMLQPHSDLKQETDATLCVVPSSHDPHDAMHWLPLVWAISITSCNSAGLQFSLERFLSVQARATVATEHVLSICYSYLLPTLLDLLHTSTAAMLPRKYYNSCGASYIFFICKISTIDIEVCMLAVKQKKNTWKSLILNTTKIIIYHVKQCEHEWLPCFSGSQAVRNLFANFCKIFYGTNFILISFNLVITVHCLCH